jgi:hypothetical protein
MKLGLIKIFAKAMNEESEGFSCLRQIFLHISEAKIKEGTFVGPQVQQTLKTPTLKIS